MCTKQIGPQKSQITRIDGESRKRRCRQPTDDLGLCDNRLIALAPQGLGYVFCCVDSAGVSSAGINSLDASLGRPTDLASNSNRRTR